MGQRIRNQGSCRICLLSLGSRKGGERGGEVVVEEGGKFVLKKKKKKKVWREEKVWDRNM